MSMSNWCSSVSGDLRTLLHPLLLSFSFGWLLVFCGGGWYVPFIWFWWLWWWKWLPSPFSKWQGIFLGGVRLKGEFRKFIRKVRSYTIFVPGSRGKADREVSHRRQCAGAYSWSNREWMHVMWNGSNSYTKANTWREGWMNRVSTRRSKNKFLLVLFSSIAQSAIARYSPSRSRPHCMTQFFGLIRV